jgi:hypothetical protein
MEMTSAALGDEGNYAVRDGLIEVFVDWIG